MEISLKAGSTIFNGKNSFKHNPHKTGAGVHEGNEGKKHKIKALFPLCVPGVLCV